MGAPSLRAAELAEAGALQRAQVVAGLWAAGDVAQADLVAAAPIDPPEHLVGDGAVLDVGGRVLTLTHPGRGHTDGDLVVGVDDVLFAGDLVEEGAPPAMEDGYPLEWPDTLSTMLGLVRGPVVPGHGAVVDAAFLTGQRDELVALARWLADPSAPGAFDKETRRTARSRL